MGITDIEDYFFDVVLNGWLSFLKEKLHPFWKVLLCIPVLFLYGIWFVVLIPLMLFIFLFSVIIEFIDEY